MKQAVSENEINRNLIYDRMTVHQANKYTDAAKENIPKIISMYQISIRHLPNTKHFSWGNYEANVKKWIGQ